MKLLNIIIIYYWNGITNCGLAYNNIKNIIYVFGVTKIDNKKKEYFGNLENDYNNKCLKYDFNKLCSKKLNNLNENKS